jgi:hypothetical protein
MGRVEFAALFRPLFCGKTAANTAKKVKFRLKSLRDAPIKKVHRASIVTLLPKNMEIDFNNPGLNANAGVSQPVARRDSTKSADDTMPFERTQALEKNLQQTSVRPEMVARASALAADENYPSDEVLNKVAGLLAGHINDGQS